MLVFSIFNNGCAKVGFPPHRRVAEVATNLSENRKLSNRPSRCNIGTPDFLQSRKSIEATEDFFSLVALLARPPHHLGGVRNSVRLIRRTTHHPKPATFADALRAFHPYGCAKVGFPPHRRVAEVATNLSENRKLSNRPSRCNIGTPDFLQSRKSIGATGFEPMTPRTPSVCATRLRYAPIH